MLKTLCRDGVGVGVMGIVMQLGFSSLLCQQKNNIYYYWVIGYVIN